jgi:hypothetical protein
MEEPMAQSNAQRAEAQEEPQQSGSPGKKPVDKFQEGPIHVSIWENASSKGTFHTATFDLRYKDKEEKWQTGHSYSLSDLRHLEAAAGEARARIEIRQQESKAQQGQSR